MVKGNKSKKLKDKNQETNEARTYLCINRAQQLYLIYIYSMSDLLWIRLIWFAFHVPHSTQIIPAIYATWELMQFKEHINQCAYTTWSIHVFFCLEMYSISVFVCLLTDISNNFAINRNLYIRIHPHNTQCQNKQTWAQCTLIKSYYIINYNLIE